MPEACILCGEWYLRQQLIAPCSCHKKNDNARMHPSCLAKMFDAHHSDEPLACRKCGEIYHVNLRYHFALAWERVLSSRAMAHAFELIIVVMMIGCGIFTMRTFWAESAAMRVREAERIQWYMENHNVTEQEAHMWVHRTGGSEIPSHGAEKLIYFLFIITMIMIPLTLYRVYGRWWKANSTAEVVHEQV